MSDGEDDQASRYPVRDAEHMMRVGVAIAAALRAGLDVRPVLPAEATAAFDVTVPDAEMTIRCVVQ